MRRRFSSIDSYLATLALSLLILTGCSGLECAEGTTDIDGQCMAVTTTDTCIDGVVVDGICQAHSSFCADGTAYDETTQSCVPESTETTTCGTNTSEEDGQCVAESAAGCGANTELDPNDNSCVPTDDNCADGTLFSADKQGCVAADEVCATGTTFSEEAGLCLPDSSCSPGDVVVEGTCITAAEALAADADVEAMGNTDPDFGGDPIELDVADYDDLSVFRGTIEVPQDLDGSGDLDQQVDHFRFDAEAGDWFEISVQSLGIPTPHFSVYAEEGGTENFYRAAPIGISGDKSRQIAVPEDGTYHLAVRPEASYQTPYALGNEDWGYVGTLKALEHPDASSVELHDDNLSGELGRLDDNYFALDGFDGFPNLELAWELFPDDADPIIQLWSSPTEFVGEFSGESMSIDISNVEELYAIVDSEIIVGTEVDYRLSAEANFTVDQVDEFVAARGDVVEITQTNPDGADITVELIHHESNSPIASEPLGAESTDIFRYIGLEDDGNYIVQLRDDDGFEPSAFTVDVETITPELVEELPTTTTGSSNDGIADPQQYYRLISTDELAIDLTLTRDSGPGFGHLFVYQVGDALVSQTPNGVNALHLEDELTVEMSGDDLHVIRVGNDLVDYADTFTYTLDIEVSDSD